MKEHLFQHAVKSRKGAGEAATLTARVAERLWIPGQTECHGAWSLPFMLPICGWSAMKRVPLIRIMGVHFLMLRVGGVYLG